MPKYNYTCSTCGELELERKMTDPEFKICPQCGGELYRVWKPIADVWKCGGNYGKSDTR